ncbi:MAG: response regulator [Pseudooceanicola sp.]|nr:response regulator [Pseudooceanicola sp.]
MVIAHIFIGTFAGLISFVVALSLGSSFWMALLLYSAIGAGTTGIVATASAMMRRNAVEEPVVEDVEPEAEVEAAPVQAPVAPKAEVVKAEGSMKVLAVDDDPFILELVPKIAEMVGCTDITVATSGAEALEKIGTASEPFDCLLLDINMPGMDGIELCTRVRQLDAYRDTSIIMLTAMSDMDHLDRAFRAGASDYTTKPFDIIEFGDRLKTAQARTEDNRNRGADSRAQAEPDSGNDWGSARLASLASVPALIDYAALQNYVTRLSGEAVEEAFAMAVNVDRTALAGDDPQAAVPVRALILVAKAIDEVFGDQKYMMAYAGHGQFVVVSSGQTMPRAPAVEGSIQERINRKGGSAGAETVVSVGTAVRPTGGRMRRARVAFENALNLASIRAAGKRGEIRSVLQKYAR